MEVKNDKQDNLERIYAIKLLPWELDIIIRRDERNTVQLVETA